MLPVTNTSLQNNNRDSKVNAEDEYETIWNSNEGKENGNDQKMNAKENGMRGPEGKNNVRNSC